MTTKTTRTFTVPADGQWHIFDSAGPIVSIEAPLTVEVDIDRNGRGWARVIRGSIPVDVTYEEVGT